MSATRWSLCPQCQVIADAVRDAALQKLESAYGAVSRAEYARLASSTDTIGPPQGTLREDFHLGISRSDHGAPVFGVLYEAMCDTCGFHFHYQADRPVPVDHPRKKS